MSKLLKLLFFAVNLNPLETEIDYTLVLCHGNIIWESVILLSMAKKNAQCLLHLSRGPLKVGARHQTATQPEDPAKDLGGGDGHM